MLTGIVKATRRHYAALQHRPAPDRVPLFYRVTARAATCDSVLTSGTIWVCAPTEARRRAECTRLLNRLRAMFPEAREFEVRFRRYGEDPGQVLSAQSEPRA